MLLLQTFHCDHVIPLNIEECFNTENSVQLLSLVTDYFLRVIRLATHPCSVAALPPVDSFKVDLWGEYVWTDKSPTCAVSRGYRADSDRQQNPKWRLTTQSKQTTEWLA